MGPGGGKQKLFGSEEFTFNLLYLKKKSFRLPPPASRANKQYGKKELDDRFPGTLMRLRNHSSNSFWPSGCWAPCAALAAHRSILGCGPEQNLLLANGYRKGREKDAWHSLLEHAQ